MNYSKRINKLIIGGIIWLVLVVLVIAIAYFIPDINGALTSTYIAKYDTAFISDTYDCYIVKNEKIVKSKNSGKSSYSIEEGTHVRKNEKIVKIGKKEYTAAQAGLVSFSTDGYENYFTEDNLKKITYKKAESLKINNTSLIKESVVKGDSIFKTVDDKKWYLIFWIDKESVGKYVKYENVDVIIDGNNRVNAKINDVVKQDKKYMIVLESMEYYPDLATQRKINAEVVNVNQDGLLIKQKSIVTQDGKPGVYVKQLNGDYKFVRVKVLALLDENAIVASGSFSETTDGVTNNVMTIKSYDEILKNAKSINKGGEKVE